MAVSVTHETVATAPNDDTKEVSSDAWNAGHTVAGLGDAAELDVGTSAGTVAAGDHTHSGLAPTGGTTGQVLKKASDTNFDYAWDDDETSEGGGVTIDDVIDALYPVGALYVSTLSTNPGTLLGRGTWSAFGAGRVLVGHNSSDADFDTGEETGGAKTKAISAHSGTAVANHASHTHDYSQVISHTHTIDITDPTHTHVERNNSSTTGGLLGWGAADTSTNTAQNTGYSTAAASTGITAASQAPAGSVATGTTTGPSATLTHSVTQPDSHSDLNVVQPYIVVFMWKRTA